MKNWKLGLKGALQNLCDFKQNDVSVDVRSKLADNFIVADERFPSDKWGCKIEKLVEFLSKSDFKGHLVALGFSNDVRDRNCKVQWLKRWVDGYHVKSLIFDK